MFSTPSHQTRFPAKFVTKLESVLLSDLEALARMGAVQGQPNLGFGRTTESKQILTHIDKTNAETNPEDDSDAKIPKGPKIKERNLKSDKPEPSEKGKELNETKIIFQSSGIASNLSKTIMQKHSAVKHVSELEEKLIPDKLAALPR